MLPMPREGTLLDKGFTLTADFFAATVQLPLFLTMDKLINLTPIQKDNRLRLHMYEHLGGGKTALFLAKDILSKGADPNTKFGKLINEPIISAATRHNLPKFVSLLKESGADTKEALLVAEEKKYGHITSILKAPHWG
jgi:hypothetical protein